MRQAEVESRPPGEEEIEHDVSPLLNCPCGILIVIDTSTVVPGACGEAGVKVRVGVGSTLNVVKAVSPLLPVAVIVYGFRVGSAALETVNEVVNVPEVDTVQVAGDAIMFAGVEVITQLVSRPLNALP
jgi:hypothetical protein